MAESYRGRIASLDAAGLAALMGELAGIGELAGRAGNYAHLRFAVDTADPEAGALLARAEELGTAINNEILFVELEWAELDDDHVAALLADPQLDFCRHYLESARRYRPHLLSEPEERILSDKGLTANSAWVRLFSELTSAITVDLDGTPASLEEGLSRLMSPDRDTRAAAAAAVTAGLEPGLRTRAFVFNTLLVDKSVDDRLRHYPSWIASRNLANEASDESVDALIAAVQARADIPQRWYALKAQLLGLPRLADYDRMASVATSDDEFGWTQAASWCSTPTRRSRPTWRDVAQRFFDESWIDAAGAAGQAGRRLLRVHRAEPAPVPVAQLDGSPPRRAHARARDGPRPARVPRTRAGDLPPDHAADARGDRVGVRRDGHLRPSPRGHRRPCRPARAAGREPRGPDRDRVPPGRDEPLRRPRAHAPA